MAGGTATLSLPKTHTEVLLPKSAAVLRLPKSTATVVAAAR